MEERAFDRLRKFARYARDKGVVKGENSFEAYCELSNRYIYNSIRNGKGAIGTDIIARIVDKFPELNVKWLCTGKGSLDIQNKRRGRHSQKPDRSRHHRLHR